MGYDSIWGLIDAGNFHEVEKWCKKNEEHIADDGYTHSVVHAAIESGDSKVAHAVVNSGANLQQVCPRTGKTAHEKLVEAVDAGVLHPELAGGLDITLKPQTGTPAPPSSQVKASKPKLAKKNSRVHEDHPAPSLYVPGEYPSKNFIKSVVQKDPSKNEADSPDTQTIVREKAKYTANLPTDPLARQKALVNIYSLESQLYPQMNLALRQDDATRLRYFGAYIKELRDVFFTDKQDQVITPFIGTTYRGITVPDVNAFLKDYQPGMEFVWEAFTSTTSDKQIARIFGNVLFEIQCHEPVTGSFDDDIPEYAPADIKPFSDTKEESEILIPPNVRFRVITVKMPTGGLGALSTNRVFTRSQ